MRRELKSIEYLAIICIALVLGSCTAKSDKKKAAADSLALKSKLSEDNLKGTFEYIEPIDKAFIRIVIKLDKNKDSLSGDFLGGVYLKKSDTGEFSDPNVLAECKLNGFIRKKKIIEMQMKLTKVDRLKKDAPDLPGLLNLSKDVSTVWIFTLEDGILVSQNGTVKSDGSLARFFWKRIK
jgi:hypothetical protein